MDIINSVNNIYEKIVITVQEQIYPLIDKSINLIYEFKPDSEIYDSYQSILKISNTLVFSILTIILILQITKKIISIYSGEEQENIIKSIFRLIIVYIIATNSSIIIETLVEIFNLIYDYVALTFKNALNQDISFINLLNEIDLANNKKVDLFSIDGLIKSIVCYGSINILICNSIRFILMFLISSLLPIIIMCIGMNKWKNLNVRIVKTILVILITPIVMKLLIVIPLCLKGKSNLILNISILGVFNIIGKLDNYIKEMM